MTAPGWSRPRLIDQLERHSFPIAGDLVATKASPNPTKRKLVASNLPTNSSSRSIPLKEPLPHRSSSNSTVEGHHSQTLPEPYSASKELKPVPNTSPSLQKSPSAMAIAEPSSTNSLGTKVIESQLASGTSHKPEPREALGGSQPRRKASLIPRLVRNAKDPPQTTSAGAPEADTAQISDKSNKVPSDAADVPPAASESAHPDSSNSKADSQTKSEEELQIPSADSQRTKETAGDATKNLASETAEMILKDGYCPKQTSTDKFRIPESEETIETPEKSVQVETAVRQKLTDGIEIRGPEAAVKAMEAHWRTHSLSSSANFTDHSGVPEVDWPRDLGPLTNVRLDLFLESGNTVQLTPARSSPPSNDVAQEFFGGHTKPSNSSVIRFVETSREAGENDSQHSAHTLKRKRSGPTGPEPMKGNTKIRRSDSSISQLMEFWEPGRGIARRPSRAVDSIVKKAPATHEQFVKQSKVNDMDKSVSRPAGEQNQTTADQAASVYEGSYFPNEAPSTLPDALSGMRPVSDMTPPALPKPTKGKVILRKVRNAAWRPALLKIALGRQLALQTKPSLRLLAKGEMLEEDDPLISNAQ